GPLMTTPSTTPHRAAAAASASPGTRRGVVLDMTLLIALVLLTIAAAEGLGTRTVQLSSSVTITVLPLVFAVLITMLLGVPTWRRGILRGVRHWWVGIMRRVYSPRTVGFSGASLIMIMLPLMARYGADVAPRVKEILSIGWVFLLQEVGNVGTVVLGLPIALLLGLRRHAIGSTLGLGREGELAYI